MALQSAAGGRKREDQSLLDMINKGKWKTDDVIHVRPPSPPRPPPAPPAAGGRPRKVMKAPAAAASAAEGVAGRDAGADEADADEADDGGSRGAVEGTARSCPGGSEVCGDAAAVDDADARQHRYSRVR